MKIDSLSSKSTYGILSYCHIISCTSALVSQQHQFLMQCSFLDIPQPDRLEPTRRMLRIGSFVFYVQCHMSKVKAYRLPQVFVVRVRLRVIGPTCHSHSIGNCQRPTAKRLYSTRTSISKLLVKGAGSTTWQQSCLCGGVGHTMQRMR